MFERELIENSDGELVEEEGISYYWKGSESDVGYYSRMYYPNEKQNKKPCNGALRYQRRDVGADFDGMNSFGAIVPGASYTLVTCAMNADRKVSDPALKTFLGRKMFISASEADPQSITLTFDYQERYSGFNVFVIEGPKGPTRSAEQGRALFNWPSSFPSAIHVPPPSSLPFKHTIEGLKYNTNYIVYVFPEGGGNGIPERVFAYTE